MNLSSMEEGLYSLHDLTDGERILLYVSQSSLIALTSVVIISTACLIISFLMNPQFHVNMIMLISNLACLCIVYSICEILTAIKILKCPETDYCFLGDYLLAGSKTIIEGLKVSAGICNVIAMPLIICERIIATVYFRCYEKQQHLYFVAFVVFVQWIISFLTVFLLFNGYIPFLLVAVPGSLVCIIFIALFFYTDFLNHKMYHESMSDGCAYTLSQRYQLCENIRTSKLLRKCSVVSSIFLPLGISLFAAQVLFTSFQYKLLFKICFEFSVAIFGLLFIASALKTNELWWRNFYRILCCKYRKKCRTLPYIQGCNNTTSVYNAKIFRTSTGKRMIFDTNLESGVYFSQLQNSWNK